MGTPVNIPHTEENNPLIRKCYTECILCKAFQCICNQEKQLETILVAAIRFGGSYQSCKFGFVEKYKGNYGIFTNLHIIHGDVTYVKEKICCPYILFVTVMHK